MKQGTLVVVTHLAHWHGTEVLPDAVVQKAVGMVGVVDRRMEDGRYEVIVPPLRGLYVFQAKELEPVRDCCPSCEGWGRWGSDVMCPRCDGTGEEAKA